MPIRGRARSAFARARADRLFNEWVGETVSTAAGISPAGLLSNRYPGILGAVDLPTAKRETS